MFPRPTLLSILYCISVSSAVFAQLMAESLYFWEDVVFRPCGRKIAQFATFVHPCGRTKVASVGYFQSTEFLRFLYFLPTKDHLAPFSIYARQKNPLLTHKLSILQLNQATFDLPASAIIHPTHPQTQPTLLLPKFLL